MAFLLCIAQKIFINTEQAFIFIQRRQGFLILLLHPHACCQDNIRIIDRLSGIIIYLHPEILDGRQHQRRRSRNADLRAQLRQTPDVAFGNAAMQQIPNDGNLQPLKAALLLPNRQKVKQRLSGVFIKAIPRIDDRSLHTACQQPRRACHGMTRIIKSAPI